MVLNIGNVLHAVTVLRAAILMEEPAVTKRAMYFVLGVVGLEVILPIYVEQQMILVAAVMELTAMRS